MADKFEKIRAECDAYNARRAQSSYPERIEISVERATRPSTIFSAFMECSNYHESYDKRTTQIKVRRVILDGVVEVQIQLEIHERKRNSGRWYQSTSSMTLNEKEAAALIAAIQNEAR